MSESQSDVENNYNCANVLFYLIYKANEMQYYYKML